MNNHSSHIVKTAEVIGIPVESTAEESLGKIEEIVLDKESGQAKYVVLSFGGLLGMGDKYFALPWKTISYSPEKKCFVLQISKDKLKDAPGFDKKHWPDMAQTQWMQGIETYYNS